MSETTREKLSESSVRLQAEHAKLAQQVEAAKQRLQTVMVERATHQKLYDTGFDSAKAAVEELTGERDTLEATITKLERAMAEYPERLATVAHELEMVRYRDGLRDLLQLRREEIAAFNEYEQLVITFIDGYDEFWRAHQRRKNKASELETIRNRYQLPHFEQGKFNAPAWGDIESWLKSPKASQMWGQPAFDRARAQIVPVD